MRLTKEGRHLCIIVDERTSAQISLNETLHNYSDQILVGGLGFLPYFRQSFPPNVVSVGRVIFHEVVEFGECMACSGLSANTEPSTEWVIHFGLT